MGRIRRDQSIPLPRRVYPHGAGYIYRPLKGRSVFLGTTLKEAQENYGKAIGQTTTRLIDDGIARQLFRRAKSSAKVRGIAFALDYEDVLTMLERANGRCELTRIWFDLDWAGEHTRRPWFPSIDRIKNDVGYLQTNCRIVCVAVNIALNTFGQEVLLQIAKALRRQKKYSQSPILVTAPLTQDTAATS